MRLVLGISGTGRNSNSFPTCLPSSLHWGSDTHWTTFYTDAPSAGGGCSPRARPPSSSHAQMPLLATGRGRSPLPGHVGPHILEQPCSLGRPTDTNTLDTLRTHTFRYPPPSPGTGFPDTLCRRHPCLAPPKAPGHNCLGRREEGKERRAGERTEIFELRKYIPSKVTLRASLLAHSVKNPPAVLETWVWELGPEDPLEKEMATHSSILAWKNPMNRGAWRTTVHGVTRVWRNLATKEETPRRLCGSKAMINLDVY